MNLSRETELIILPPGTSANVGGFRNDTLAGYAGAASVTVDMVEVGTTAVIVPFFPQIPSIVDTGAGFLSSIFTGETYAYQRPHDCLPPMTMLGQDALVPLLDLGIASGAEATLPPVGGFVGGAVTENPLGLVFGTAGGYVAARGIDAGLSTAGGYYDAGRLPDQWREWLEGFSPVPIYKMPTYIGVGIVWETPPHIAFLYYQQ